MRAVDEQEAEWRPPMRRDANRIADHRDDNVFQTGFAHRLLEEGEGIDASGRRIDRRRVVVFPPGLHLFRSMVVVDREEHRPALARGGAEVYRGLPAVRSDLEQRSVSERSG